MKIKAKKLTLGLVVVSLVAIVVGGQALATEKLEYETLKKDSPFELRQYDSYLQARVTVDSAFDDAGNEAFRTLFRYIDGNNSSQQSVAMTAPVTQQPSSQKIAMTAPVTQQAESAGRYDIAFVMPKEWTLETLPSPSDSRVNVERVEAKTVAVIRYSGGWSQKRYDKHLAKLEQWIADQDIQTSGEPTWARYNAPFVPWFMRRNEILIPVVYAAKDPD